MKVWLFYWVGYVVLSFIFAYVPFVEMIWSTPFVILSALLVDIYYEVNLAIVVALVNPKMRMLDRIYAIVEEKGEPAVEKLLTKATEMYETVQTQVQDLVSKRD